MLKAIRAPFLSYYPENMLFTKLTAIRSSFWSSGKELNESTTRKHFGLVPARPGAGSG